MIIGTRFYNVVEEEMRIHLQPRLDMTCATASSLPIWMLYLALLQHSYMSYAGLLYMAVFFCLSPLPHCSPMLETHVSSSGLPPGRLSPLTEPCYRNTSLAAEESGCNRCGHSRSPRHLQAGCIPPWCCWSLSRLRCPVTVHVRACEREFYTPRRNPKTAAGSMLSASFRAHVQR